MVAGPCPCPCPLAREIHGDSDRAVHAHSRSTVIVSVPLPPPPGSGEPTPVTDTRQRVIADGATLVVDEVPPQPLTAASSPIAARAVENRDDSEERRTIQDHPKNGSPECKLRDRSQALQAPHCRDWRRQSR